MFVSLYQVSKGHPKFSPVPH